MKNRLRYIIITACAIIPVWVKAQTTSFDVDGIKVIFKPTVKQIINVKMFYRGGVSNYTAAQAGIERFALNAAIECGTKKYTGEEFREKGDTHSIDFGVNAEYDYSAIEMQCVSKYFDEGWDLFADAVTAPVFNANEVGLLKEKLSGLVRQNKTDPDNHTEKLMIESAFAGTPYATDPDGDELVVSKLTAEDLKAYYGTIFNKNQMFIVVAGKITKEELIAKIHASFAATPSKPYTQPMYKEPVWSDYKIRFENRALATNYIEAIMNAPSVNSPDYVAYRLGMSVLGGSLFNELRTRLHLSYAPGAHAEMKRMPFGLMYVSTTDPKAAVAAMVSQLSRFKDNTISDRGLKDLKSSYITSNYMNQQSTSDITKNLGVAEIMGSWELEENLPAAIDAVTPDQIKNVANRYIVGLRWAFLGNQSDAAGAF